jgi:BolA family transcriptional regulator, general stress-responsive regulator
MMNLIQTVESRLKAAFQPSKLVVIDESHRHAGHVAHEEGGRHMAIEIAAPVFDGMQRITAHRMIYALFDDLMPHVLHALKIKIVDIKSCQS